MKTGNYSGLDLCAALSNASSRLENALMLIGDSSIGSRIPASVADEDSWLDGYKAALADVSRLLEGVRR